MKSKTIIIGAAGIWEKYNQLNEEQTANDNIIHTKAPGTRHSYRKGTKDIPI